MKIGMLGTGIVGRTIGGRLIALGHQVMMGSRTADHAGATQWATDAGDGASHGTFADAGRWAPALFNCTAGAGSLEALASIDEADLADKVLIDVANPLDFSQGFPPALSVANTDSLAEQIQRAHPRLRVVKSLNTMNCEIMVNPSRLGGPHNVFLSSDDSDAKAVVAGLLGELGWPEGWMIDLGDLSSARGTEMFVPLWLRLLGTVGSGQFNIAIVR